MHIEYNWENQKERDHRWVDNNKMVLREVGWGGI
jgi:hypothetical protein